MKRTVAYCLLASLILVGSCKKHELPEEALNSPDFNAAVTVDGKAIALEAGNNGYYMYSSHFLDSMCMLDVYKADLRQSSCNGACDYALTVLINDSKVSAPGVAMRPDTALAIGSHLYNDLSTDPLTYKGTLVPADNFDATSTYSWVISNGLNTVSFNTYSVNYTFDANFKYTVTLHTDDQQGGCQVTHTNEFRIGNPLQTEILVAREQPNTEFKYLFSAKTRGYPPYSYLWDFGDGSPVSTEANPTHTFSIQSKPYNTRLQMIDAHKDTCVSYIQVVSSPDSPCEANFKSVFKPVYNPRVFSSVTVILTDPNGESFTTKGFVQPAQSKFEVTEVSDYRKTNDLGEKTKKLRAVFNCVLKNGGKTVTINNAVVTLGVSYK